MRDDSSEIFLYALNQALLQKSKVIVMNFPKEIYTIDVSKAFEFIRSNRPCTLQLVLNHCATKEVTA